jgi:hypothetical protein
LPPLVIVPPVALNRTGIGDVLLSLMSATAVKTFVSPVSTVALLGVITSARGVGVAAEMVTAAVSERPELSFVAATQYVPGVLPAV